MFEEISSAITAAMKARDKVRLETLRAIKKDFLEAKTAPGGRAHREPEGYHSSRGSYIGKGYGQSDGRGHQSSCR